MFPHQIAAMGYLCVLHMRQCFNFIVVDDLPDCSPIVYSTGCFLQCLWDIQAVFKLIFGIIPKRDSTGKILVCTIDTFLQQWILYLYNIFNLGTVYEKTPMNIFCQPLRVETWIL